MYVAWFHSNFALAATPRDLSTFEDKGGIENWEIGQDIGTRRVRTPKR